MRPPDLPPADTADEQDLDAHRASRAPAVTDAEIVEVAVTALLPGESPRLEGQNDAHVVRLAEVDVPLPPILVDRRTMQVIDGTHRFMAAALRGAATIAVQFYDGTADDAFLHAVEANVRHGFPLSQPDRRAAATRIIASHPHLSDRAIANIAGLGAKTVATLRRTSGDPVPQPAARVGKDGRLRPVNSHEGRLKAAKVLAECPETPLRVVARIAGVSPATAGDVRKRLARGEAPTPTRAGRGRTGPRTTPVVPAEVLGKLIRDPALRHREDGRQLLRRLQSGAIGPQEWNDLVAAVPPHCVTLVRELALSYAKDWTWFAQELDGGRKTGDRQPDHAPLGDEP